MELTHAGSPKIGSIKISAFEVSPDKGREPDLGDFEISASEVGDFEISASEVGTEEVWLYVWMSFSPIIPLIDVLQKNIYLVLLCHIVYPFYSFIIINRRLSVYKIKRFLGFL
jgi:hypothetical protein